MSTYEKWKLVSFLLGMASILATIAWAKNRKAGRHLQAEVWYLRAAGSFVAVWLGWTIVDLSLHKGPGIVSFDLLWLALSLWDLWSWWKRNRKRLAAKLDGYKARAIKARMARRAAEAGA